VQELYDVHIDTTYEMYRMFIVESHTFFKNVFPALSILSFKEQELIFKDYVSKMGMIEGYRMIAQYNCGETKNAT
ncbi:hypothetical protein PENTCL1PPCAC_15450, partial [Pristionchus entomophagus]